MKKCVFSFFLAVVVIFTFFVPVPVYATVDNIFLDPENSNLPLINVDSDIDVDYYNNQALQYKDIYIKVISEIEENVFTNESFNYSGSLYQAYLPFIDIEDYDCELIITNYELNWAFESDKLKLIPSSTSNSYALYSISFDSQYNFMNFTSSHSNVKRYAGTTEITFLPSFYKIAFPDEIATPDLDNIEVAPIFYVDVDVDSFSDWIINNGKYVDIIDSGLNVSIDKIKYFVSWWKEYRSSPIRMALGIPELITNINIINIDISLIKSVCNCIDNLYIEYKQYLTDMENKKIQYGHSYWPGHLKEDEEEKDYTLITDTDEDDIYILLLREIIRTISALPDYISVRFNFLHIYFDNLFINFNYLYNYLVDMPVNIANEIKLIFNGFGFADIDFKISDLLNDIKLSIENTVESSKENLEELFIPTSEPFTELKEEIYLKLPVLNQLSGLPNFDGYLEDNENNTPETVSLSAVDSVSSSGSNSLSMFNVSFYDSSVYNGVSFDIVDFTKWQKAIEAFKGICSVVIIFHFVHWLIAFIPKLLSGYNSSN